MMRRCLLLCLTMAVCCISLAEPGIASRAPALDAKSPFGDLVEAYFDAYFAWKPSEGTAAGLHQYDSQLEDRAAAAITKRIAAVKTLQAQLQLIRQNKLGFDEDIDAQVLDGLMRAELLDLETLRNWRNNPMGYISAPSSAIDGLMKRSFAPPAERLRSVTARLRQTPALFHALKANVENPPKEFTDLAIRISKGTISYFKDTLATWAKEAAGNDAALLLSSVRPTTKW